MKFLLITSMILIQTDIHAMEVASTEFIVNEDSILHELNTIPKLCQQDNLNKKLDDLFERLLDLKQLHARDTNQTNEPWQNPNFIHWLVWFEAELKKTIIASTKQNNYYLTSETILHYAAKHHKHHLLKFLINMGITPRLCKNNTLRHVRNQTIAQFLIQHGEVKLAGTDYTFVLKSFCPLQTSLEPMFLYAPLINHGIPENIKLWPDPPLKLPCLESPGNQNSFKEIILHQYNVLTAEELHNQKK